MKKVFSALRRFFKNSGYAISFLMKTEPRYGILLFVEAIILGLIHALPTIVFVKIIYDKIEVGASFVEIAAAILWLLLFIIVSNAANSVNWFVFFPVLNQRIHKIMQRVVLEKAVSLDLSSYDDPKFFNDFIWTMRNIDNRLTKVLSGWMDALTRLVTTVTVISLLVSVDLKIVLLILVSVAISGALTYWRNRISFNLNTAFRPLGKKDSYLWRLFAQAKYAKDIRMGQNDKMMMDCFEEYEDESEKLNKKYYRIFTLPESLDVVNRNVLCSMSTHALLLAGLVGGAISLGGFAAAYNAVSKLRWSVDTMVRRLVSASEQNPYVEKLREFLETEPKIKGGTRIPDAFERMELRHVTFRYTADGEPALQDVSLTVTRGEKVALVGYNGAGKTTLIKLLLRFYDVTEGEILYNGVNIKEYDLVAYRRKIGTVFQDYQIFAGTIAENVMAGIYTEKDKEAVLHALRCSAFQEKLDSLPKGIDTELTREFDEHGEELSGGEAQKVAIARVFARPYDIIVMDEPSSALDPMSEYELNVSVANHAKESTVIFISHRLSTTHDVDKIYMFDTSRLVEEGSHAALMAQNGKYAYMFNLQAEKYRLGETL